MSQLTTQSEPPATVDDDVVLLTVPADGGYLGVLRTATAGLAARLHFALDEIEDLRIAVDEACAMLLAIATRDAELECRFAVDRRRADRRGDRADRAGARLPAESSFAWKVLTALTTSASADVGRRSGHDRAAHPPLRRLLTDRRVRPAVTRRRGRVGRRRADQQPAPRPGRAPSAARPARPARLDHEPADRQQHQLKHDRRARGRRPAGCSSAPAEQPRARPRRRRRTRSPAAPTRRSVAVAVRSAHRPGRRRAARAPTASAQQQPDRPAQGDGHRVGVDRSRAPRYRPAGVPRGTVPPMRALLVVNPKATTTSERSRDVLVRALRSEVDLSVRVHPPPRARGRPGPARRPRRASTWSSRSAATARSTRWSTG